MDNFDINSGNSNKSDVPVAARLNNRPKIPPPPPPKLDGATLQKEETNFKDSPPGSTSISQSLPVLPKPQVPKRRKSKDGKLSVSSEEDGQHFSGKKKLFSKRRHSKQRSSDSSATFYVALDPENSSESPSITNSHDNSEDKLPASEVDLLAAGSKHQVSETTESSGVNQEQCDSSQTPKSRSVNKRRQLPVPPVEITVHVPEPSQPELKLKQSQHTENNTNRDDRGINEKTSALEDKGNIKDLAVITQHTVNQNNVSNSDSSLSAKPVAPTRKKHLRKHHRIITQDIPSHLLSGFMACEITDSGSSSAGSLDNLGVISDKSDNAFSSDREDRSTAPKPLSNTPPTAKKPKPKILRPKPNLNAFRSKISSFTAEDIDISQKDKPSDSSGGENAASSFRGLRANGCFLEADKEDGRNRRRSRSVDQLSVDQMNRHLMKPAIQAKPKFPLNSSCGSVSPVTAPKPKQKLPVPPKPKCLPQKNACFSADSSINSSEMVTTNITSSSTEPSVTPEHAAADELITNKSSTKTENVNVDSIVGTSPKTDEPHVTKSAEKVVNKKHVTKVSRKVSRKMSLKQRKLHLQEFKDTDLKDDIIEGKEEDISFSDSDIEDMLSDDSFTDEEDLEFEKEQAAFLGLSPLKQETDSQPSSPTDEEPKDKLYQIANELLDTERAYIAKLKLIDQVFHLRVVVENREHHFLPENLIPQIFINVESIYQFHEFLLRQLEDRMKQWESVQKLGDIMKRWAPFLKLYTEYINKFNNAMMTFNMCVEKYPRFASIVDEIQAMPECGMLLLQHHMLEPIQRVPRYELLLKDYLNHLPDDSSDTEDTKVALELITKAAEHANETIRKSEHAERLLNICEKLIGASTLNLISPTRRLIKEGSIIKISARDGSHQERYLFLFNDYLLVCVPVTLSKLVKHHYKVRDKLDIEGMKIMEGDDLYTPNTFLVKSKTRSIEFHTSTAEEKDEWQAVLWATISEYTKKQMSRITGNMLTDTFEKEELGKRAPTWIKDQATSMCMLCGREFTTFFRRHHCRACGWVICGLCSTRKARLAYDDSKYNRVCDNCYYILELKLDPRVLKLKGQQRRNKTLRGVKASDPSIISGYLYMSMNKKTWEKRYFSVRENFVLYSFKAHEDVFALTHLPLPGYVVSQPKEDNQVKGKHIFKLFHIGLKKEYFFQAEDNETVNKWVSVLEKLVRAELPHCYNTRQQALPTTTPNTVKLTS